jgi:DNA polymerase-3 subunit epsilon
VDPVILQVYVKLRALLKLERPLVVFDLETHDKSDPVHIVQISGVRIPVEGEVTYFNRYVKPPVPVTEGAQEVHGLSDQFLADKPMFGEIASEMYEKFKDADLAGYNSARFDFGVLCAEFLRAGLEFPVLADLKQIDAMRIFYHHAPRNLEAAYTNYTGKVMEGAHDALVDINATAEVLLAQIIREMQNPTEVGFTFQSLSDFTKGDSIDWAGKLVELDGEVCYNFGKNQGKPVKHDTGYAYWMLKNDFPQETKSILRRVLGLD